MLTLYYLSLDSCNMLIGPTIDRLLEQGICLIANGFNVLCANECQVWPRIHQEIAWEVGHLKSLVYTDTLLGSWPRVSNCYYDDVTFSALLALCAGNSPAPVNSPHKGQWRGALMFSFIYAWINDWVNNREAGDLRRQRGHYDVIVMIITNYDTTSDLS